MKNSYFINPNKILYNKVYGIKKTGEELQKEWELEQLKLPEKYCKEFYEWLDVHWKYDEEKL